MTDAVNAPVRRRRETVNTDLPIGKPSELDLDEIDRDQLIVKTEGDTLHKEYADALAFAEEPITIVIHPSDAENAPKSIPAWVQGKGAEVKQADGRWLEITYLPVNVELTTKRKYVEVLARSKVTRVSTRIEDEKGERPRNVLDRNNSSTAMFSVLGDTNPRGRAWLMQLMADRH